PARVRHRTGAMRYRWSSRARRSHSPAHGAMPAASRGAPVVASEGTLSAARSTRDAGSIDQNYRYWREHGAQWVAEYEERKRTLVYYHLQRVLAELIRVSRWQVLHIEPSPTCAIVPDAQQGCWNHDLPRAYRNLGHVCEVLAPGYGVQSPYRILLSRERAPYEWSPVLLGLYRQLETDVQ